LRESGGDQAMRDGGRRPDTSTRHAAPSTLARLVVGGELRDSRAEAGRDWQQAGNQG
jgi:hypothetical protein